MEKVLLSPRLRSAIAFTAVAYALALVPRCVNQPNPYRDQGKSDCAFVGLPPDTVAIFSTFSFTIDVLLAMHLQSVTLHIDHNRLWNSSDTTFGPDVLNKLENMSLNVSFADTGLHALRLVGKRFSGDSIVRQATLYAQSPLNQPNVFSAIGATVTLRTPPVKDPGVLYVWDIKQGRPLVSDTPAFSFVVDSQLTVTNAELYVKSGAVRSPSRFFTMRLQNPPPQITITEPAGPAHIKDSSVIVRGTVVDSDGIASLTVNNIEATRNDPNWNTTIPLVHGYNTIRVVAVDSNKSPATDSVTVIQNRPPKFAFTATGFDTVLSVAQPYTVTIQAIDGDRDSLRFQLLKSGVGSLIKVTNGYATISYAPANPGVDTFTLAVNDSWNDSDTLIWRIKVASIGDPRPFFVPQSSQIPYQQKVSIRPPPGRLIPTIDRLPIHC
jgi:hypothetical protein